MAVKKLKSGLVKRRENRSLGVFIDGVALDRATRRLKRKVDLQRLLRGVTSGTPASVARYYTVIPNEDDSRQRAFLDAVASAGFDVVIKRLPPKGVTRQVSIELEMACDIVAFAHGQETFSETSRYIPSGVRADETKVKPDVPAPSESEKSVDKRIVTVVCPSRELSYPLALIGDMKIDTVTADFSQFAVGNVLKSAAKWIDLSDSETIWRE